MTHMPTDTAILTPFLRQVYPGPDTWGVPAPPLNPCPPAHPMVLRDDEPDMDAFTWRQCQYHWQYKNVIGFANAVAVARRDHLAHFPRPHQWAHPLPRPCPHPFPPSPPIDTFFIHFAWCTSGLLSTFCRWEFWIPRFTLLISAAP